MQLFINTPGTVVRQKDECFRLKQADRTCDISPQKVESMIVSNKILISSQAIALALSHNIDVIFLDSYGDPVGRVWHSKMGSTALIRRKQLEAADNEIGFSLVIEMVSRKLQNQESFLKKLNASRPGKEKSFENALRTIGNSLAEIQGLENGNENWKESVRGLEGTAGRAYFGCISSIMPEKFRFDGRSKRPAKDPFNAALNYCYGIMYSQTEKACIVSGLDPYVGFLHTDNYNKRSLVFDFIEPFRIFAELPAVYLFTGRKMKGEYFDIEESAVSLNNKGKPVVVDAITKHLEESVRYRRRNVKRKFILRHEGHRMANRLLEGEDVQRPDWLDIREI